MSTYYFLVCDRCQARVDFLRNPGEGGRFMAGAIERVPRFVGCHDAHHQELQVIQEADERSWTYTEYNGGPCDEEDDIGPKRLAEYTRAEIASVIWPA